MDHEEQQLEVADVTPDHQLTDREIALETLRLTRETHDAMIGTQALVKSIVEEVGPMVESFANNPMLKTLGFGKKFGK